MPVASRSAVSSVLPVSMGGLVTSMHEKMTVECVHEVYVWQCTFRLPHGQCHGKAPGAQGSAGLWIGAAC